MRYYDLLANRKNYCRVGLNRYSRFKSNRMVVLFLSKKFTPRDSVFEYKLRRLKS
jgi:hypothetical protein